MHDNARRIRSRPAASELLVETFEMAQQTEAADALAQMSARFAAGSSAFSAAVRKWQDLVRRRQAADERLSIAAAQADTVAEEAACKDTSSLDGRLDALDRRLAKEFPDYAELVRPKPLNIDAV